MMSLFSRKENRILSPFTGEAIPLKNVNDPVFSQCMMGNGAAIIPSSGELVSPIDGEVVLIAPTKHAIGLKNDNGLEIMIHIGIDSFKSDGEGFKYCIKVGDKVKAGDNLGFVDLSYFENKEIDMTTVVVVLNKNFIITKNVDNEFGITKGDCLLKYTK